MERQGFDSIDEAFREDLENLRAKIGAEMDTEHKKKKGYRFNEHQATWKIDHYPYSAREGARAQKNHEQAMASGDAQRRADVDARLSEQKVILEQLHFGKLGRQHALEQVEREEKIAAFKARQRPSESKENQIEQNQAEQATPLQQAGQGKTSPPSARAEFQKQTKQTLQKTEIEEKIQAFKNRVRQRETEVNARQNEASIETSTVYDQPETPTNVSHDQKFVDETKARKEDFKQRFRDDFNRYSIEGNGEQERD